MQQPSNPGGGATDELRSDAKELGSKAANRLHSEVDSRKGAAVRQAQSVSSAIGKTADSLDDSAPQWLKSAFQQGAQKIQQFADTLERSPDHQPRDPEAAIPRGRPARSPEALESSPNGSAAPRIPRGGRLCRRAAGRGMARGGAAR